MKTGGPAPHAGHGELDRDQRAVAPHRGQLDPTVDDRPLPGLQILTQPLAVTLAQLRRDDQLRKVHAEDVLAPVAEEALGRLVELDHGSLIVHADDAVHRAGEQRRFEALARLDLRLGPPPFDEARQLVGERRQQRHQLVRVRVEGAGVELGDREHAIRRADRDRDRHRGGQAELTGDRPTRIVGVDAEVRRPGDFAGLPGPAEQPPPGAEDRVPTRRPEGLRIDLRDAPAGEEIQFIVHLRAPPRGRRPPSAAVRRAWRGSGGGIAERAARDQPRGKLALAAQVATEVQLLRSSHYDKLLKSFLLVRPFSSRSLDRHEIGYPPGPTGALGLIRIVNRDLNEEEAAMFRCEKCGSGYSMRAACSWEACQRSLPVTGHSPPHLRARWRGRDEAGEQRSPYSSRIPLKRIPLDRNTGRGAERGRRRLARPGA